METTRSILLAGRALKRGVVAGHAGTVAHRPQRGVAVRAVAPSHSSSS